MSTNTKYNVVINDEVVETKSKKAQALEAAQARHDADPTIEVKVVTSGGTEVQIFAAKSKHAAPWTRTEEVDGIELEVPAGYTVAYKRTRVGALVARADDKSGWIVVTEDGVTECKNTTEAREFTNSLATSYKEKRVAEQAAEAERKAQAKKDREEERARKAKERDDEKARKAAEKAAAKAAKEAEAAAEAATEAEANEPAMA